MNLELFDELAKEMPSQHVSEWRLFLELCEMYMKKRGVERPIVVELGVWQNRQKKFYEQLLGAEHIGIDAIDKRSTPDILGNTHDPKTLEELKEKLRGRRINILFIDAGHSYKSVTRDWDIYTPLCDDIIVLHDTETYRHRDKKINKVHIFWDELKEKSFSGPAEYRDFLFIELHAHHWRGKTNRGLGLGMIIKK